MAEMLAAWLLIALLYLIGGVYTHLRYNGSVSKYLPASLFCIGGAIFIAVNRWWWFNPGLVHTWLEYLMLIFAFFGWVFLVLSARVQAEMHVGAVGAD